MSIYRGFTPPEFAKILSEFIETRTDYRVLSYMLDDDRMLEYAQSIGVSDWRLRDLAPAIPPFHLRQLVAAHEEPVFLWTGMVDAAYFLRLFAHHGGMQQGSAIFDFGCGCGRLTRYLGVTDYIRTFASDINPGLVEWCRANLSTVDTRLNGEKPPLPFDGAAFDCCYSLSIFTHLPEDLVKLWLDEIARVVRPGGLFAFTTHGELTLEIIGGSAQHQDMFRVTPARAVQIADEISGGGYVYLPYEGDQLSFANAGSDYGNTFVGETRIRRWSDESGQWEFIDFRAGGLRGWQDIVVLRRR